MLNQEISLLQWRMRRGLLENDLILQSFFNRYKDTLTVEDIKLIHRLLDLDDCDLMDLLLSRKEPSETISTNSNIMRILNMMKICKEQK